MIEGIVRTVGSKARSIPQFQWLLDGRLDGGECPNCGEYSLVLEGTEAYCTSCSYEDDFAEDVPGWV